jgi:PLP dependent protein
MSIQDNILRLRQEIPDSVKLVAVSKTKSTGAILEAYKAGQTIFGENKVQELVEKQMLLPEDIEWHFIGHLQTNKVRQIASFIYCIESIDSLKLLIEVNKEAQKNNRVISCLLQFHIASEDTKYGLDGESAQLLLDSEEFSQMKNIRIHGVMGMATFCTHPEVIRTEFRMLKQYFELLRQNYFPDPDFCEISMGMSGDYRIAIEEGSTLVRIGTAFFGDRLVN